MIDGTMSLEDQAICGREDHNAPNETGHQDGIGALKLQENARLISSKDESCALQNNRVA